MKSSRPNPVQEKAADTDQLHALLELENAVYQAIGCIYLLQKRLEQIIIEESGDVSHSTAAGIYNVSEAASDRLQNAFDLAFDSYKAAHRDPASAGAQ
ncbi:MAG: hypothetical protein NT154_05750 [Verrucomicrobia bacterium]|nr:hypothetical protein [Verrucomicrobiota bacterium]